MDSELLVTNRFEEGQRLITELSASGFDVSVAFWVKAWEEDLWSLYIASTSVEAAKIDDAYRALYACLGRLPDIGITISDVKLISPADPIAQDAMAARDQKPRHIAVQVRERSLGNMPIDEAYIYPPMSGEMTAAEMLQTLYGLANRSAHMAVRPSIITFRDGTSVTAFITGFNLQMPGKLTIYYAQDAASKNRNEAQGEDVLRLQPI